MRSSRHHELDSSKNIQIELRITKLSPENTVMYCAFDLDYSMRIGLNLDMIHLPKSVLKIRSDSKSQFTTSTC